MPPSSLAALDIYALLQTVAQIAATFAGFGALASTISVRSDRDRMDGNRLRVVLITSLIAMLFALAPCGFALLDLSDAWVWRASGIFALVVTVVTVPATLLRAQRIARTPGFNWPLGIVMFVLFLISVATHVMCALGVPAGHLAATYFFGLFAMLTLAALLFARLIVSFLNAAKPS
jgi:O-antigen/teichoic acid export membrane protein